MNMDSQDLYEEGMEALRNARLNDGIPEAQRTFALMAQAYFLAYQVRESYWGGIQDEFRTAEDL